MIRASWSMTVKRVFIGSLLVMHLGFLHFTMPTISSGNETQYFSTTSKSLIILILAEGAIKAMRLMTSSGKKVSATFIMPFVPSFFD